MRETLVLGGVVPFAAPKRVSRERFAPPSTWTGFRRKRPPPAASPSLRSPGAGLSLSLEGKGPQCHSALCWSITGHVRTGKDEAWGRGWFELMSYVLSLPYNPRYLM